MPILLCASLERKPGSCPEAVLLFLDYSSLVSASPPLPGQHLSAPAPWNSGKVVEAEGGPFPKNKKWGTLEGLCAQDPHRALLSFRWKVLKTPFLGSVNMLKQLTKLRVTVYLLDDQLLQKDISQKHPDPTFGNMKT